MGHISNQHLSAFARPIQRLQKPKENRVEVQAVTFWLQCRSRFPSSAGTNFGQKKAGTEAGFWLGANEFRKQKVFLGLGL